MPPDQEIGFSKEVSNDGRAEGQGRSLRAVVASGPAKCMRLSQMMQVDLAEPEGFAGVN